MTWRVAYYLTVFAVILTSSKFFQVKGQTTAQGCEDGNSPINIVAEIQRLFVQEVSQLQSEQAQLIQKILNASSQQMKNQHDSAMRRLDAAIRLLLYHDISIKNQTQNSWKLAVGVPLRLEIGIDTEDGLILLPSENNWIIIMNRFDGSLNFNRNWTEYKNGFGNVGRGEFWLGNEIVHRLTNRIGVVYALRIEVQPDKSTSWFSADYSTFSLDSEANKYAIRLSGFSGNAGDTLTNTSVTLHANMSFSTYDNNNDGSSDRSYNCANRYEAGWWFNFCLQACLTCPYGMNNFVWTHSNDWQSGGKLRAARMMIKTG